MRNNFSFITQFSIVTIFGLLLAACSDNKPTSPERYKPVDALAETIIENLRSTPSLELVADIDHSKLAAKTAAQMPPARVIIFSNIELEIRLLKENQLLGLDLPFKVLAYENIQGSPSATHNNYDYLTSRYNLKSKPSLSEAHNQTYRQALAGINNSKYRTFSNDSMNPDGIITIDSLYDFKTTIERIHLAINAQDDTIEFGEIDYQQKAADLGEKIRPTTMILFGAPAPGAEAMRNSITLGLDAFCQKFLVWEDAEGKVHLSYNDLLAIADRQNVDKAIALRVIDYRLSKTFSSALTE